VSNEEHVKIFKKGVATSPSVFISNPQEKAFAVRDKNRMSCAFLFSFCESKMKVFYQS